MDGERGIQMLTLLVKIFKNCLLQCEKLQYGTRFQTSLHQQSFQWLNKIFPKYPREFKTLMSQSTELKTKFENAVRSSHQQAQRPARQIGTTKQQMKAPAPSIKLKTDFSNFS